MLPATVSHDDSTLASVDVAHPEFWFFHAALVKAAEGELKGVILVALTTGQRLQNILTLRKCDVDFAKNLIHFRLAKTTIQLEVSLDIRVRIWLEQQPESVIPEEWDSLLFPQLAARGPTRTARFLQNCGDKIGIFVTALSFRNAFFQRLSREGVPISVIRKLMGYRPHRR